MLGAGRAVAVSVSFTADVGMVSVCATEVLRRRLLSSALGEEQGQTGREGRVDLGSFW